MVGSTSASPSCSVISTAVRAASDSREPPADDARSSSDEGCGAGSSCRVAASGARAPVSQSASSMVSLCAQYISVRYLCNPPEACHLIGFASSISACGTYKLPAQLHN